ncbi:MAG: tyrosine-protein phosphatase [Pseudomonadota bacterium]
MNIWQRIVDWEQKLRARYNVDLSTPENRRRANIYNLWFDHAILRTFWTNFFEIAPGVFRSNQPTHARFEKLKKQGVKTIINLRGSSGAAHYLVEEESCEQLGLTLISLNLNARYASEKQEILKLITAFRNAEKPFVIHCKSGADRAGFASVIYLLVIENRPLEAARKMLGVKYLHLKFSKTGVLDFILDLYQERQKAGDISFEAWINEEYDPEEIQAAYRARYSPLF